MLDMGLGTTAKVQDPAAGKRDEIARATRLRGLSAKPGIGIFGRAGLSLADRRLQGRCVEGQGHGFGGTVTVGAVATGQDVAGGAMA